MTDLAVADVIPRGRRWWGRVVGLFAWGYLAGAVTAWGLLRWAAERWWPATLFLFGPRWVLAGPAVPLAIVTLVGRRWRSAAVVGVATVVIVGPVMSLCLPWRHLPAWRESGGFGLRVLTCNVHDVTGGPFRRQAIVDLMKAEQPDVIALQEWANWSAPTAQPGWHLVTDGELRLECRWPVRRIGPVFPSPGWAHGAAVAYAIDTPAGPVQFINLHLASPHDSISLAARLTPEGGTILAANSLKRGREAAAVGRAAAVATDDGGLNGVVLAGDFNLPTDSPHFRHAFAGLTDAFVEAGWGFGWTYLHKGTAVRIDHVLAGPEWRCVRCRVGPYVGSPHRPVIAELALMNGGSPPAR